MDPFSITVGALSLVKAVSFTIEVLKQASGAPRAIFELSNEILELDLILQHLQKRMQVCTAAQADKTCMTETNIKLLATTERATATLKEMHEVLTQICSSDSFSKDDSAEVDPSMAIEKATSTTSSSSLCKLTRPPKIKLLGWRKAMTRLKGAQEKLHQLKVTMMLMLLVNNTVQLSHKNEAPGSLYDAADPIPTPDYAKLLEDFMGKQQILLQTMKQHAQFMSVTVEQQRSIKFGGFEEVCHRSSGPVLRQSRTGGGSENVDSSLVKYEKKNETSSVIASKEGGVSVVQSSKFVRTTNASFDKRRGRCHWSCPCSCHKPIAFTTVDALAGMVGKFLVDFNLPQALKRKCSERACQRNTTPMAQGTFIFPYWLLPVIITGKISVPSPYDMHIDLRAARVVPDSNPIFKYVTEGNLQGVMKLFDEGKASPYDVDTTTGSIISYAVDRGHYHVWRYLLQCGGNKYYETKTKHGAIEIACTKLFSLDNPVVNSETPLPTDASAYMIALKEDFDVEEYLSRLQLSTLHKIVLKLVDIDLKSYLEVSTADLEVRDYQGRTALAWATIRADETAITTLLSFGADPNVRSRSMDTPLHCAVRAASPCGVQHLVDHGANVDARNEWKITPMCYTTAHRDDPEYLSPLLKAGADPNIPDKHGRTPILRAAIHNRAKLTRCLLEHGAEFATDMWGNNPLVTAIQVKSADVVQVLLEYAGGALDKGQIMSTLDVAKSVEDIVAIEELEKLLAQIVD